MRKPRCIGLKVLSLLDIHRESIWDTWEALWGVNRLFFLILLFLKKSQRVQGEGLAGINPGGSRSSWWEVHQLARLTQLHQEQLFLIPYHRGRTRIPQQQSSMESLERAYLSTCLSICLSTPSSWLQYLCTSLAGLLWEVEVAMAVIQMPTSRHMDSTRWHQVCKTSV